MDRAADTRFMGQALGLAEAAVEKGQTPFGAVVVDPAGRLIGEGHTTVFRLSRVVFAAGSDVPTYKPLLGIDLLGASAWVNAQPDWPPVEVVADFMRERALQTIAAFPWQSEPKDNPT